MGSLSLLQWIILTQESNQGLLHCRCILYQLSYRLFKGNPKKSEFLSHVQPFVTLVHGILHARILEWVAFPIVRESLQPRAQVSHIVGGFFTS